jgi:dephospho-CoA kinase
MQNLIKQTRCKKIVFTGEMATGKSYLAQKEARKLKCLYFSVDKWVAENHTKYSPYSKEYIKQNISVQLLKSLEKPFIKPLLKEIHNLCKKQKVIVFEFPLLFELGMQKIFDDVRVIKTIPYKQKWFAIKRKQDMELMKKLLKRFKPYQSKTGKLIIN